MLELAPRDIHLWLAHFNTLEDSSLRVLHDNYRALLNNAERAQERRFHFPRDRRRFLITRALTRLVLSRYVHLAPECWTFATNEYGRPEASNVEARDYGLNFNLSHTAGLIVMGVTRNRALGVDVENIDAREAALDIADRYFGSEEVSALAATDELRRPDRFFEYWTFKESYIKARGMGLSIPLHKFSFELCDEVSVALSLHPDLSDDASRWQFWQYRPIKECIIAVCAARIAATRISLRTIVPQVSEHGLECEPTRTSR